MIEFDSVQETKIPDKLLRKLKKIPINYWVREIGKKMQSLIENIILDSPISKKKGYDHNSSNISDFEFDNNASKNLKRLNSNSIIGKRSTNLNFG